MARALTAVIAAAAAVLAAGQQFTFSNVLGDHMVLQRDSASTLVWGFGKPGAGVATTLGSVTVKTTVGNDGIWRQALPSTPAGGPYDITSVCSTGETATLSDVLFGDVFICGGQSNMQFTLPSVFNATEEVARADDYPSIRIMTVGQGTTSYTPLQQLGSIAQPWSVASSASVGMGNWTQFSAVCWLTGRNIYDALGGAVPIGLLSSNWGGTRVQAWSTNATNALCNTSISEEEEVVAPAEPAFPTSLTGGPGANNATVLYNAMIAPLALGPLAVKGFTWFQAEANAGQPAVYSCAFPAMISQWRRDFAVPSAYFGFVVMEPWVTTANLSALRTAQLAAYETLANVGYAAAQDIGDVLGPWGSVHPRAKQIPSARLAASAMAVAYGKQLSASWTGPVPTSATGSAASGNLVVTVSFTAASLQGGGLALVAPDMLVACPVSLGLEPALCAWPQVQASNGQWVNATLSLATGGTQLVFTAPAPAGTTPVAVQYANGIWPVSSVYSAASYATKYEAVQFPVQGFLLPVQQQAVPHAGSLRGAQ